MKILYVTTVASTMGFFLNQFKMLLNDGNVIELACSDTWKYNSKIADLKLKTYYIPFSRSPLSKDNLIAYKQLKKIVNSNNYDIVHCHTPVASVITRFVCKSIRKNGLMVFYTAHGFHFYKGAPLKNWLLYYPIELLCSYWTDKLITINHEDYAFAQRHMRACKIEYVPGVGIDLARFSKSGIDKVAKCSELGLPKDAVLLLSVGELNKNKNHETVIRALGLMGDKNIFYLIAGQGDQSEHLRKIARESGVYNQVILLGYRRDINELCEVSELFVFPSFREGLSVSLMEAMAAGMPIVCSKIRGNVDLIDGPGGFLFCPASVIECKIAIEKALASDRKAMGEYNQKRVKQFSSEIVMSEISRIYETI